MILLSSIVVTLRKNSLDSQRRPLALLKSAYDNLEMVRPVEEIRVLDGVLACEGAAK